MKPISRFKKIVIKFEFQAVKVLAALPPPETNWNGEHGMDLVNFLMVVLFLVCAIAAGYQLGMFVSEHCKNKKDNDK